MLYFGHICDRGCFLAEPSVADGQWLSHEAESRVPQATNPDGQLNMGCRVFHEANSVTESVGECLVL